MTTVKKPGRTPKEPHEKKVQVIFYITQMYAKDFRDKVQPIADRINKKRTSVLK